MSPTDYRDRIEPHVPTRTRAAMLYGARDLRTTELDVPALGEQDVLVQVAAVGVCGSDMHYFAAGRNGQNVLRATNGPRPRSLGRGHRGRVERPGRRRHPGRRRARAWVRPLRDLPAGGVQRLPGPGPASARRPAHGTMTEYLVVPDRAAHPLPDSIDTVVGSMIEPLSVAVWAVQRAQVGLGDRVLVTGAGPIGLLVAQVARAAGATEVIVTDINDHRLAVAAELGATRTINTATTPLDEDLRYDRVIECTGMPAVLWSTIRTVRPHGRVTVVGQAAPSVDGLPLAHLQRYEIDLVTAFRYAHAYPTAIALVASGAVDIDRIVTGRFGLDRASDAVQAPLTDPTPSQGRRHPVVPYVPQSRKSRPAVRRAGGQHARHLHYGPPPERTDDHDRYRRPACREARRDRPRRPGERPARRLGGPGRDVLENVRLRHLRHRLRADLQQGVLPDHLPSRRHHRIVRDIRGRLLPPARSVVCSSPTSGRSTAANGCW